MKQSQISELEDLLGYKFSDNRHLIKAMTHSSSADNRLDSNERFEFFGDSILSLVICLYLFNNFPDYQEGDLTKIKSLIVSRKSCAVVSNKIGLPLYTTLGKGMSKTRAVSGSIAAGTLEAVIAAIYLDSDFEHASDFILRVFGAMLKKADANGHQNNFKSILQQYCQQQYNSSPVYELLDEKGPDHNKCFEVQVAVNNRFFESAWGVTKKDAEQKAAYNALVEMGRIKEEEGLKA